MRPRRHPLLSVIVAFGLIVLMWARVSADPVDDRNAMIGTWTDEFGPPENSIRFYFVARPMPAFPGTTAYDGHVTLAHFLGKAEASGSWVYCDWDPLILSMSAGDLVYYVAIRRLDDDHLL